MAKTSVDVAEPTADDYRRARDIFASMTPGERQALIRLIYEVSRAIVTLVLRDEE